MKITTTHKEQTTINYDIREDKPTILCVKYTHREGYSIGICNQIENKKTELWIEFTEEQLIELKKSIDNKLEPKETI